MNLKHLTDHTLLLDTKSLAKEERAILSKLLWHLKEIDERKLYSTQRCGSLFEYCIKILKYSEGQASRRVSAARLLNEIPELSIKIEDGQLNLTQLNQAKNFFNEENISDKDLKKKVLSLIEGQSTRESEKILWSLKNEDAPRKIMISMKEETFAKIKKVQALKGYRYQNLDHFLDLACETLDKLWNPVFRKIKQKPIKSKNNSRYIPQSYKIFVWQRDEGRCVVCGSFYALEIDHIKPFAVGGKNHPENLRLLCKNCNQRKRIEYFGSRRRIDVISLSSKLEIP